MPLKKSQVALLVWLRDQGSVTTADIADHIGANMSSAHDRMIRLQARGLVRRSPSRKYWRLTRGGVGAIK